MRDIENVHRCEDSEKLQFRQPIPDDLQELVGKKVIKRSLDGLDEEVARKRVAAYAAEYEDLFERLRSGKGQTIDAGIISYLLHCLRDQV